MHDLHISLMQAIKKVCHVYLRYKIAHLVLQSIGYGKYLLHDEMFIVNNSFRQECREKNMSGYSGLFIKSLELLECLCRIAHKSKTGEPFHFTIKLFQDLTSCDSITIGNKKTQKLSPIQFRWKISYWLLFVHNFIYFFSHCWCLTDGY